MLAACKGAAAGLLLAAALPAAAQTVRLEPSPVMRCLSPAAEERGAPEYPFDAWKQEQKGRVRVELRFTSPDSRPKVEVLASEGEGGSEAAFVEAVKKHVATYRVPCLSAAAGSSTRLQMEFIFAPQQRWARSSAPTDPDALRRTELMKCVAHLDGQTSPPYPAQVLREQLQGRVLARLHFTATDQPPQVQVLSRPAAQRLADSVSGFVQGYRMPCFDGKDPVDLTFTYIFRIEGTGAYGMKPLDLVQLMARVRGIRQQTLLLDTQAMGCPFDVGFQYRQPYMNNVVQEVGGRNTARRPLLEWLESQHLDLPSRELDAVFGDDTVITVPCAKINLKPQETS